jgi:hypothetical protein
VTPPRTVVRVRPPKAKPAPKAKPKRPRVPRDWTPPESLRLDAVDWTRVSDRGLAIAVSVAVPLSVGQTP